jgi:hypothetical protein
MHKHIFPQSRNQRNVIISTSSIPALLLDPKIRLVLKGVKKVSLLSIGSELYMELLLSKVFKLEVRSPKICSLIAPKVT